MNEQIADLGLRLSYIMVGVAVLGILLFATIQIIKDFRSSIASVLGVIGIGLIFFIMYGTTTEATAEAEFSAGMIQAASAGIMTTYALGGLAILGIIIGELWSSFR